MKETKEMKTQKGITLIALVITIIVMLILVAVTISMAVNGGLFEYAASAGTQTSDAIKAEQELASGKINVGGEQYDSIDNYVAGKPKTYVYAILYDDGTLVFNSTGKKKDGKTVVFESGNIAEKIFNQSSEVPWVSFVNNIAIVEIEDKIRPYSTSVWFANCGNLTEIKNIENLDTSLTTNMMGMFYKCSNLSSVDISGFKTSRVTDMRSMFNGINWTGIDVSSFDTSNVEDMSFMFSFTKLNEIIGLSKFNTSKVKKMNSMFSDSNNLKKLDVSSFDTSNVENMKTMFAAGVDKEMALEEIKGLSKFNTAKVTDMVSMFQNCTKLEEIDVSSFNTSNVTTMDNMFANCISLKKIFLPKSFSKIQLSEANKPPFNGVSSELKIYCEVDSKPEGWPNNWYQRTESGYCTVEWGVTKAEYDAL